MVGVWVGNEGGEGRFDLTGISKAAPVMFKIFNILPENRWLEVFQDMLQKKSYPFAMNQGKSRVRCRRIRQILRLKNHPFKYQQCNYHQEVMLSRNQLRLSPACHVNAVLKDTFFVPALVYGVLLQTIQYII
ncbi:MAG: hypothetical protein IPO37_03530 [Saprospiraceae bacterium]|nr:hypothetical protein [Saprospiraceae bacterium]